MKQKRRHRGGVTPLPLTYFDPSAPMAGSSSEGYDRLHANAQVIRPRIGGGGKRRTIKARGGFIPSVMEGFVSATARYVAPIALMTMYKYATKESAPHRNRRSKRATRRRRRV